MYLSQDRHCLLYRSLVPLRNHQVEPANLPPRPTIQRILSSINPRFQPKVTYHVSTSSFGSSALDAHRSAVAPHSRTLSSNRFLSMLSRLALLSSRQVSLLPFWTPTRRAVLKSLEGRNSRVHSVREVILKIIANKSPA